MAQRSRRRRAVPFALVGLVILAASAACSGEDSPESGKPVETSGVSTPAESVGAPAPSVCDLPEINDEACQTAIAVDEALRSGTVSGFDIDPKAKEAFDPVLGRAQELRVTAIGCPFAAVALGCGPGFGIAVSSVTPGTDARGANGITRALAFVRDADCDVSVIYTSGPPADGVSSLCKPDGSAGTPMLTEVKFQADDEFVNILVNGGMAQGGTLAGRPKGITDTRVRSEWFPYPDEPQPEVPDALKGVPLQKLTLGHSVPLNELLFIATGCWGCDGPTSGLDRVYRLGGEVIREEVVLPDDGIRSVAVRPDSQEVILVTCQLAHCGDFGPAQPEMVSTVHRSVDGGVSWEKVATFEDYASVRTFTPGGYVVTVWTPAADLVDGEYSYYVMPERRQVRPPAGTSEFGGFRVLGDGELAFQSEDLQRWLREDGSVGYELPFPVHVDRVNDIDTRDGAHLISWSSDLGPGRHTSYSVLWQGGKALVGLIDSGNGIGFRPGQWRGPGQFVGNVFVSDKELGLPRSQLYEYERSVPAHVDLQRGTATPIDTPFFEANYRMNRTYVVGAWHGDRLARVNTPGDCLNLRETGAPDAQVITCLKHGTLIAMDALGGTPPPGWVRVFGPMGQLGYVAEEFLER